MNKIFILLSCLMVAGPAMAVQLQPEMQLNILRASEPSDIGSQSSELSIQYADDENSSGKLMCVREGGSMSSDGLLRVFAPHVEYSWYFDRPIAGQEMQYEDCKSLLLDIERSLAKGKRIGISLSAPEQNSRPGRPLETIYRNAEFTGLAN